MKRRFYIKAIPIPLYYGNFVIIFSDDVARVAKTVNTQDTLNEASYTFHNFRYEGRESFAVWFNPWPDDEADTLNMGLFMHEINHCGNAVFMSRGIQPDYDNDEAECYLKGWMAEEVEKFHKTIKL